MTLFCPDCTATGGHMGTCPTLSENKLRRVLKLLNEVDEENSMMAANEGVSQEPLDAIRDLVNEVLDAP